MVPPGNVNLMTAQTRPREGAAATKRSQQNLQETNGSVIAVANVISGPADFASWTLESFAATFETLGKVGGVRQFHLDRLAGAGNWCLFVSYTFWNTLADFDRWRTSAAFIAAHPDRAKYWHEFSRMQTLRYNVEASPLTTIDEVRAEVARRLSGERPDLIADSRAFVNELSWAPT